MALGVKDWDRHQHFTRRRPTWIKLWHTLLVDVKFQRLPRLSQALLPQFWLLASEYDKGIVDMDAPDIAHRLRWQEEEFEEAVRPCINAGFLIVGARSADVIRKIALLSVRRQKQAENDAKIEPENDLFQNLSPSEQTIIPSNQNNLKQPETTSPSESESESEAEKESNRKSLTDRHNVVSKTKTTPAKVKAADVDRMVKAYNDACEEFEVNWPTCQVVGPKREGAIRKLLADSEVFGGIEGWSTMLARAARSSWLNGKTPRRAPYESWKADILYFCRPDVFAEVMEGKHDDRVVKANDKPQGGTSSRARAYAALDRAASRRSV